MATVLWTIWNIRLMSNPRKCRINFQETTYVGYVLEQGKVCPLVGKIQASQDQLSPITQKQVRQFFGLVRYYCCFIPHFASFAAPLTGLLTKDQQQQVRWTLDCEMAFWTLKDCLCRENVLYSPDLVRSSPRPLKERSTWFSTLARSCFPGSELFHH